MGKYYTPTKLSENIRETPEGFLLCIGVPIARTGEMLYGEGETPLETDDEGKILIYRDAEEVFHVDTVASFEGKAVTIKHPEDFVSPTNWSYLAKGIIQNVRQADEPDEDGEEVLLADLLIMDALAIQLIKAGLREVSCGYEAEYEQTGEGKGRQSKIIGNHLALVEQGRAGQSYAINDHKGKVTMKTTLLEKLTKRFGAKVIDEVMAEEKKESKSKDESEKKDEKESKDAASYDELVKMVKDLGEKIEGMGKGKDEKEEPAKKEEKEKPAAKDEDEKEEKSEDADEEASLEERLKALETAVAKLLEKQTGDEDEESEDEDEESEDEDEESESESKDEESEKKKMTGDTASRAEILSPGIKASKGTDVRVKALEAAYATKDGKAVIHALTGGKKPVFDSAEKISTLFIAASEVLKANRGTGLEKTKNGQAFDQSSSEVAGDMTAEKMNEINAAHWARK